MRSLEILTGGSPRLIAIVARFGAGRSFRELMADLLDLVDDHTEYFKSHLESLPAQERRVYLALAALWKPAAAREIAEHARLDPSQCSAQLARLGERGVVQVAGGSARRKRYYLTERLYNIYYLLRRRRGPDPLVEALVRFMESYYSPRELMDIGARMVSEISRLDPDWRGHLIRATAALAEGDRSGCEQDVGAILEILPELDSLPEGVVETLVDFSVELGPERMRELIAGSRSATLLQPLLAALEQELGIESRVAREVEEVACDVRDDLARRRR